MPVLIVPTDARPRGREAVKTHIAANSLIVGYGLRETLCKRWVKPYRLVAEKPTCAVCARLADVKP